jgi:membrane protein implicated in regulation of membrane protease activity
MLLYAAPAYADSVSSPGGSSFAFDIVFLAAIVVLIVAAVSLWTLRRAAARRREREEWERSRQQTGDTPESPG